MKHSFHCAVLLLIGLLSLSGKSIAIPMTMQFVDTPAGLDPGNFLDTHEYGTDFLDFPVGERIQFTQTARGGNLFDLTITNLNTYTMLDTILVNEIFDAIGDYLLTFDGVAHRPGAPADAHEALYFGDIAAGASVTRQNIALDTARFGNQVYQIGSVGYLSSAIDSTASVFARVPTPSTISLMVLSLGLFPLRRRIIPA